MRCAGHFIAAFWFVASCANVQRADNPEVIIRGPRVTMTSVFGPRVTHYEIAVLRCTGCVADIRVVGYPINEIGQVISDEPIRAQRSVRSADAPIHYPVFLSTGAWVVEVTLYFGDEVVARNDFRTLVR